MKSAITNQKKKVIILLLIVLMGSNLSAQDFKLALNLPSFAANNISIQGEYAFNPSMSALMGFSYHYPKGTFSGNHEMFKDYRTNLRGVIFTPEFRYYPKKMAPKGFYIGPYLRFMNYTTDWDGQIKGDSIVFVDYTAKLKLTEFGIGGQLGYQFLIKDKVSIDLMIFGPRYSHFELTGKFTGILNAEDILGLIDIEGIDLVKYYKLFKFMFDFLEQSARFSLPLDFASMRFGVTIGYKF